MKNDGFLASANVNAIHVKVKDYTRLAYRHESHIHERISARTKVLIIIQRVDYILSSFLLILRSNVF